MTDPTTMFSLRHVFDGKVAGQDPYVFASEYAVTTGGGKGNLIVRFQFSRVFCHRSGIVGIGFVARA